VVEVGRRLESRIQVSSMVARTGPVPFSTPLGAEIINAPRYRKVKMPTVDLYDRTTGPDEHLGLYKAQMFV